MFAINPSSPTTSDLSPPSPSLSTTSFISSISLMQKTPNELIPMLKNAYDTLKDRERDLRLAAEIGKSLLENNIALKSNYQDLLNTPFPTPTHSTNVINKEEEDEINYIPIHRTREALVEILEKENDDLSLQLEEALLNQDKLDRKNIKKSRQLEKQVEFLQTSLDHATMKIQELEEENNKKKTLTKEGCTKHTFNTDENNNNETVLPSLWMNDQCVVVTNQIEELKRENDQLIQSKTEIEKNLCASLQDLRLLKQQCEQFQFTVEAHEKLKQSFETQNLHIQELKSSLEEHRLVFSKLRDRGIQIPFSFTSDDTSSSNSNSDMNKYNLLTELENAWLKHQSHQSTIKSTESNYSNNSSSIFKPFQAIYNQLPNVDSALESIILKAGVVEKDALDDALSLIGRLENEYDHKKFLKEKRHIYYKESIDYNSLYDEKQNDYYQHEEVFIKEENVSSPSLIQRVKNSIQSMIYLTWRWFRFIIVMTIAIFISLKDGPNSL